MSATHECFCRESKVSKMYSSPFSTYNMTKVLDSICNRVQNDRYTENVTNQLFCMTCYFNCMCKILLKCIPPSLPPSLVLHTRFTLSCLQFKLHTPWPRKWRYILYRGFRMIMSVICHFLCSQSYYLVMYCNLIKVFTE